MRFSFLALMLAIVAAEPVIIELFLGKPTEGLSSETMYGLGELNSEQNEDDYLDQLSAIDACDPSLTKCQVYSLVQMSDGQLAIVNLGWWDDLKKNVQNVANKAKQGLNKVKQLGSQATKFIHDNQNKIEETANMINPKLGGLVHKGIEYEGKANDAIQHANIGLTQLNQ